MRPTPESGPRRQPGTSTARLAWLTCLLTIFVLLAACGRQREQAQPDAIPGGDAERGKQLITQYGCGACHTIPGVRGTKGVVGPPLANIGDRTFIGGKVRNTPENMIKWLQDPQAFDPDNGMPKLGVTPADARDIAAFLFTLK